MDKIKCGDGGRGGGGVMPLPSISLHIKSEPPTMPRTVLKVWFVGVVGDGGGLDLS